MQWLVPLCYSCGYVLIYNLKNYLSVLIFNMVSNCLFVFTALSTNGSAVSATNTTQNGGGTPIKQSVGVQLPTPKRILYERDMVQIGWKNGRKWSVGTGMTNVGNTCYLNSTLQALFHVPSFANWLFSDEEHRRGGCIDPSKWKFKLKN